MSNPGIPPKIPFCTSMASLSSNGSQERTETSNCPSSEKTQVVQKRTSNEALTRPDEDDRPTKIAKLSESQTPDTITRASSAVLAKIASDCEVWSSPNTNCLMQLIPKLRPASNPLRLIEIEVCTSENGSTIFQIPQFALASLSPYFKRMFSHQMCETTSNRMKWIGSSDQPNIHVQAAAQIMQFAQCKCNILDKENYRSLKALKEKFPKEFNLILSDIIRLCNIYEIDDLKLECIRFIEMELNSSEEEKIKEYFLWAFESCDQEECFKSALKSLSDNNGNRLKLYPLLISLFDAEFTECKEEDEIAFQNFIQDCFVELLPDTAGEMELIKISKCFIKLFPQFDFPAKLIEKMSQHSKWIDLTQINNPSLLYVLKFCKQNEFINENIEILEYKTPFECEQEQNLFMQPINSDELKEYKLLIQAMISPKENRIKLLYDIITKHPENIHALRLLSRTYYLNSDFLNSIKICDIILNIKPNDCIALRQRSRCYYLRKDHEKSLNDLSRLIVLQPNDYTHFYKRSECYYNLNNMDAMMKDLNDSIKLNSNNPQLHIIKGLHHMSISSFELAIEDFNSASQFTPLDAFITSNLSQCHYELGHYEKALENYQLAIELVNHSPLSVTENNAIFKADALLNQGECYMKMGKFDKALEKFDAGYGLSDSFNPFILKRKSECYMEMGKFDEALENLQELLKTRPEDPTILELQKECIEQKLLAAIRKDDQ